MLEMVSWVKRREKREDADKTLNWAVLVFEKCYGNRDRAQYMKAAGTVPLLVVWQVYGGYGEWMEGKGLLWDVLKGMVKVLHIITSVWKDEDMRSFIA
jgi:hypothetical protein